VAFTGSARQLALLAPIDAVSRIESAGRDVVLYATVEVADQPPLATGRLRRGGSGYRQHRYHLRWGPSLRQGPERGPPPSSATVIADSAAAAGQADKVAAPAQTAAS